MPAPYTSLFHNFFPLCHIEILPINSKAIDLLAVAPHQAVYPLSYQEIDVEPVSYAFNKGVGFEIGFAVS